jgi:hypothetical protein
MQSTSFAVAGAAPARSLAVSSVLAAGMLFGTTGTARALGPAATASTVAAARILVASVVLVDVASAASAWRSGGRWPARTVAI